MCGIFCTILKESGTIRPKDFVGSQIDGDVKNLLSRRGPDCHNICCVENVILAGFVLWQQGTYPTTQPVSNGNILLLFNGDLFNIDHIKPHNISDSQWLCDRLSECQNDEEICELLSGLKGPFSLIIYNTITKYVYFARDCMGRTSLIVEANPEEIRILSSSYVSCKSKYQSLELPPLGLFKINTYNLTDSRIFPWGKLNDDWKIQAHKIETFLEIKFLLSNCINVEKFNKDAPIINYDFYNLCNDKFSTSEQLFQRLIQEKEIMFVLNKFGSLLEESVKYRVQKTAPFCKTCLLTRQKCNHSKIAILFSGGIDCSILAVLVHKFANKDDSIDLINVAFECLGNQNSKWDVPDRISAKKSYEDLLKLCPFRKWNFIEVNVLREELHSAMVNHLKHLIYPLNTVLDESIGASFWFAARGEGKCIEKDFKSQARVAIVGSGADELFGGYMRHKKAYLRCSGSEVTKKSAVEKELNFDIQRLPLRNLGRDDRVIADSGKTVRAPFIEENLFYFVNGLKSHQRCCFLLDDGVGDKLLLRLYGYKVGLRFSVELKKRAIQFGTKIAKKNENASDISKYLQ